MGATRAATSPRRRSRLGRGDLPVRRGGKGCPARGGGVVCLACRNPHVTPLDATRDADWLRDAPRR